jgi:hypothetical protein
MFKTTWDLKIIMFYQPFIWRQEQEITDALVDGWEPFAVDVTGRVHHLYLKRKH